ncbi:MAG TPA: hypothetical protein PK440_17300, partial [Candidatus Accumulibacter phosphatis]|nr:hypothetical protein [Candidatus Accumulibacter phosphatis]
MGELLEKPSRRWSGGCIDAIDAIAGILVDGPMAYLIVLLEEFSSDWHAYRMLTRRSASKWACSIALGADGAEPLQLRSGSIYYRPN